VYERGYNVQRFEAPMAVKVVVGRHFADPEITPFLLFHVQDFDLRLQQTIKLITRF
jgi:hypothetical protein